MPTANYDGRKVIFGLDDSGEIIGIENPKRVCLDIENKINDTIHPRPEYELSITDSNQTVTLFVKPGWHKPYMYKSKTYKRNDTATIEVDTLELTRLILQGKNIDFESLPSENQDLTFHVLPERAMKEMEIEQLSKDVLKTLNLYNDRNGLKKAAELLSDQNSFPGIDIARFDDSMNIILSRATFEGKSVLSQMEKTLSLFRGHYRYEEISGSVRKHVGLIPQEAFREALANAIIHRVWDTDSRIRVMMFRDRIEISSPGGLPTGISKAEYLQGKVSVLRNPILGNVFYRLHLVEILGTGIVRIKEFYNHSARKPLFEVSENAIHVTLPVIALLKMTDDEASVYDLLSAAIPRSTGEITEMVPFGKSKTTSLLRNLAEKGYISVIGNGRGTKYKKESTL